MIVLILPPNFGEMMPNVDLRVVFFKMGGLQPPTIIYVYI